MPSLDPKTFSPWQLILLQSYEGGEFSYLVDEGVPDVFGLGDSLLSFLLIDLAQSEDCDSFEEAIARIDTALDQLMDVRAALSEALPTTEFVPLGTLPSKAVQEEGSCTIVVIERTSPLPPPSPDCLLYTVPLALVEDEEAMLLHVAEIRYEEVIDGMDEGFDPGILQQVKEGLVLQFAFGEGGAVLRDYRS